MFTSFRVSRGSDPLVNKWAVAACKLNNLFGVLCDSLRELPLILPNKNYTNNNKPTQISMSLFTDLNLKNIYNVLLYFLGI